MKIHDLKSQPCKASAFGLLILMLFASCKNGTIEADAFGNFEAIETMVSAEASGRVIDFNVNEGEILEQGALVGLIDTALIALQSGEIQAQRQKVSANMLLIDAQNQVLEQQILNLNVDINRLNNLQATGATTQKQVDDAVGQLKVFEKQKKSNLAQKQAIEKELSILEAKEKVIREQLKKCQIVNPVKGTVLQRYAEPGEVTQAGKPLYKTANIDQLVLRAYVSGSMLGKVIINNSCTVRIDKGKKEFETVTGRISWVSAQAEFTPKIIQTKQERVNMVYAIKIEVPNSGALKIGMPGEVIF